MYYVRFCPIIIVTVSIIVDVTGRTYKKKTYYSFVPNSDGVNSSVASSSDILYVQCFNCAR
jgi:hypothetical protein